jgi:hemoglobin
MSTQASLFERIGGMTAVNAAVDRFYERVTADELLAPFFEGVDMNRQRAIQKTFLAFAFGAPTAYSGRDLRSAHAPMVGAGLAEEHFAAVAGHLQSTLEELGVPQDLSAEVMAIAASTHDDVLGLGEAPSSEAA